MRDKGCGIRDQGSGIIMPAPMTRADIEKVLNEHAAGFETRDAERLAATHTADGTFESPAVGLVRGRPAILNVYLYWYKAFPDFVLTWGRPIIDPPRAAVFWTFEGTAEGPFFGDPKPGTHVKMVGTAEYTFSPEGIVSVRHLFDFSAVLVATGVLKIRPT
jgi:predicted ester cyclase